MWKQNANIIREHDDKEEDNTYILNSNFPSAFGDGTHCKGSDQYIRHGELLDIYLGNKDKRKNKASHINNTSILRTGRAIVSYFKQI